MKIVYCIPALYNSGGMERVLTVKANYLAEKFHHEVWIITTSQEGKEFFYSLSKSVHHLDLGIDYFSESENILKKTLQRFRKKRIHRKKLSQVLNDLKPDVTISLFTHEMTFLPKIKDGSVKILEYHFSREMEKIKSLETKQSFLRRLLTCVQNRFFYSCIAKYGAFVVLTERDAEAWGKLPNIRVIPNPLTIEIPEGTGPLSRNKTVLSVGRLCRQKGFDFLLEAWRQICSEFSDWTLEIVGSGPLKNELEDFILLNGLEKTVRIVSPDREIERRYRNCAVFAATSRYEGFHLALLEAQGAGMPAVTFDSPCGPAEIVEDGKTGFVIPVGDISSFAGKLKILMQDESLRETFGKNAVFSVGRKFKLDPIMKKWERLLVEKKGLNKR